MSSKETGSKVFLLICIGPILDSEQVNKTSLFR